MTKKHFYLFYISFGASETIRSLAFYGDYGLFGGGTFVDVEQTICMWTFLNRFIIFKRELTCYVTVYLPCFVWELTKPRICL